MINHLEKLLKNPDRVAEVLTLRRPKTQPQPPIPDGWGTYPAHLTNAAVLLLLQPTPQGTQIWFVQRSMELRQHAGQIAFPGGKQESDDASLWHTAVRESEEEIGAEAGAVRRLGGLDECWTPSGFRIHPFVGWNEGRPPDGRPNSEIERAFCLSLTQLDAARQAAPPWPRFATPHGVIWGATGRILHNYLEILREAST